MNILVHLCLIAEIFAGACFGSYIGMCVHDAIPLIQGARVEPPPLSPHDNYPVLETLPPIEWKS